MAVFRALLTALRVPGHDLADQQLARVFARLLHAHPEILQLAREREGSPGRLRALSGFGSARRPQEPKFELDLNHVTLCDVDLTGLDLSKTRFGEANLSGTNVTGSNLVDCDFGQAVLRRLRAVEPTSFKRARFEDANLQEAELDGAHLPSAYFRRANLVSAQLRGAHLSNAVFIDAKLQSAHLDRAVLRAARFDHADVNDTWFHGAIFDETAMRSLLNETNWQESHLDADARQWAEELARRSP
jgi:uncharacterized protein YjbI with pentapeptide repeats